MFAKEFLVDMQTLALKMYLAIWFCSFPDYVLNWNQ